MIKFTESKSIYTLANPVWLDAAGMLKGIKHDRQPLGIILAAGNTLKIRQSNAKFKANLKLRLLNDDCQTESEVSIGSNWVEVNIHVASVPFIDTPYMNGKPVVEFVYEYTEKTLPIYSKGESETAFFASWDAQDAEFGFITSEYVNLLVPKVSKKQLMELGEGQNIDVLLAQYDSIFTFYNELAGLYFEPTRESDRNIRNRYFIKADKNGVGGAYFGNWWAAECGNSISKFWLAMKDNQWGILDMISLGYECGFMKDKAFFGAEMSGSIYAAIYQEMMLGKQKYQQGWLYNYGNMAQIEEKIIDMIAQSTPFNHWDLRSKLYFLMLMMSKAGTEAFTHFNQYYRELCNMPGSVPSEHKLLDMLCSSYALAGEQVDVAPFIQLAGGQVTYAYQNSMHISPAKAVYPLFLLVDNELLPRVQEELGLDSPLQLVDVSQLKASRLKGYVTLNFQIDDFAQISGEELILMEGTSCAFKTRINNPTMVLKALPIGVYTLRLPTGRDRKYQPASGYLVVKQGNSEQQLHFVKKISSPIVSQQINLLGLNDDLFASVDVDHAGGKLVIDVIKNTPHSHFRGKIYAQISLRNPQGTVVFSKDIYGTQTGLSNDELPLIEGDVLEISHCEQHLALLSPAQSGVIDQKSKTNLFTITKYGLRNNACQEHPKLALLERLETAARKLRANSSASLAVISPLKDDIYLAINLFDTPCREQLLETYKDCLPVICDLPAAYVGKIFTIVCKGINDREFMSVVINLAAKVLILRVESGIAHDRFNDIYVLCNIRDPQGNNIHQEEIFGNQNQKERSKIIPLSAEGGEIIHLYHQEPKNRLVITNDTQLSRIPDMGKRQTYRITPMGLKYIA